MKRYLPALIFLTLLLLLGRARTSLAQPAVQTPPPPLELTVEQAVRQAVDRFEQESSAPIFFTTQVDNVRLSNGLTWGTADLIPLNTETGFPIPTEPGLALAFQSPEGWKTLLPDEEGWTEALQGLPEDLMTPEAKTYWLERDLSEQEQSALGPLRGFRLPWARGKTMFMTQSVQHDRYDSSLKAHYAFDFAAPGYPSDMFEIHAAKSGRVYRFYDELPNGTQDPSNPNIVNYLVIEDPTTTPYTYHLYLHLAQNSIPEALKSRGAWVEMGQVIGVADNTGRSSGNHLHFHVHTNPNSYWGTSVDVVFEDISINGGRPRNKKDLSYCLNNSTFQDVCQATSETYVSGNVAFQGDSTPPVGEILSPAEEGTVVLTTTLELEGFAFDGQSGLESAQFLARWGDAWQPVGPLFSEVSFAHTWDLCQAGVPDGPFSLALALEDRAGNHAGDLPGLRQLIKQAPCPPPPPAACQPGDNQLALYSGAGFTGDCQLFSVGDSTSSFLSPVGVDRAASLRLGKNVQATLFDNLNYTGRAETFTRDDPNLSDNRIGAGTVSSLKVRSLSQSAAAPRPVYPPTGAIFTGSDGNNSWSLSWEDAGFGVEFQARLRFGTAILNTSPWQPETFWHLGSLSPGVYTWQVRSRSQEQKKLGQEPAWPSTWFSFEIPKPDLTPTLAEPLNEPILLFADGKGAGRGQAPGPMVEQPLFFDDMEAANEWVTSQNWDRTLSDPHSGTLSWAYDANTKAGAGYDTGMPHGGSLTSPEIPLPEGDQYQLRFWYRVQTESSGRHWDQRWVQVSVDGGPFANLLQLSEDPTLYWMQSPPVDISAYAGHTVRLRFYFATLDAAYNNFAGWQIDDVSITLEPPSTCALPDGDSNDPTGAAPILPGQLLEAAICPAGDKDYFAFQGSAGETVAFSTEAQGWGSALDTVLYLLAPDGSSILAEGDDLVPLKVRDSHLSYTLPADGTYYIKVRAWDHPSSGGDGYTYRLRFVQDSLPPSAAFNFPESETSLALVPQAVVVSAEDQGSGLRQVDFYWHSSDWQNGAWQWLGADLDGSDGWSIHFDPNQASPMTGAAFFARAWDWAGNAGPAGAWNLTFGQPFGLYLPGILR